MFRSKGSDKNEVTVKISAKTLDRKINKILIDSRVVYAIESHWRCIEKEEIKKARRMTDLTFVTDYHCDL